jgi:hypothetical protein
MTYWRRRDMNKLYRSLCSRDKRSPGYLDLFPPDEYEESEVVPRKNCYCENCYYGRDRLAGIAIDLLAACERMAAIFEAEPEALGIYKAHRQLLEEAILKAKEE